jgi:hypothetical protein
VSCLEAVEKAALVHDGFNREAYAVTERTGRARQSMMRVEMVVDRYRWQWGRCYSPEVQLDVRAKSSEWPELCSEASNYVNQCPHFTGTFVFTNTGTTPHNRTSHQLQASSITRGLSALLSNKKPRIGRLLHSMGILKEFTFQIIN